MNSDLQAIMARRRKLADGGGGSGGAMAGASAGAGASSTGGGRVGQGQPPPSSPVATTSPSSPHEASMSPDLRAILERRRQLAEPLTDGGAPRSGGGTLPNALPLPSSSDHDDTGGLTSSQRRSSSGLRVQIPPPSNSGTISRASGHGGKAATKTTTAKTAAAPPPIQPSQSTHSDDAVLVPTSNDEFDNDDDEEEEEDGMENSNAPPRRRPTSRHNPPTTTTASHRRPTSNRSSRSDDAVLMAGEGPENDGDDDDDDDELLQSDEDHEEARNVVAPASVVPAVATGSLGAARVVLPPQSRSPSPPAPPGVAHDDHHIPSSADDRDRPRSSPQKSQKRPTASHHHHRTRRRPSTGEGTELLAAGGGGGAVAAPPLRRQTSSGDGSTYDAGEEEGNNTARSADASSLSSGGGGSGDGGHAALTHQYPPSLLRRASRRSSTGSNSGDEHQPPMSLDALHRASRRRSTAMGIGAASSSDDCSRAESSVASSQSRRSSVSGAGGGGATRRSGRRRPSHDGSSSLLHTGSGPGAQQRRQDSHRSFASEADPIEEEPPSPAAAAAHHQKQSSRPAATSSQGRRTLAHEGRSTSVRSFESSDEAARPPPKPRREHRRRSEVEADADQHPSSSDNGPKQQRHASPSKSQPPVAADPMGWGDFGAFSSTDTAGNAAAAAAFSSDFAGFPNDDDAGAFAAFGEFPAPTASKGTRHAPKAAVAAAAPVDFGADDGFAGGDFGFPAFGADASAASSSMASHPQALFGAAKETSWDTSPLVKVPVRPTPELALTPSTMFKHSSMLGRPITSPSNGNILFCSSGLRGAMIHEIDPRRDNVQVMSAVILSPELQRRVASKYNASPCGVGTVLSLAAGLHVANGQVRVRVAAMVDFQVVESPQLMRVVVVWQWGYGSPHPVALQFVMTPPSGGEFTYDPAMLQVADGLLFVGGYSPKGPCVFMCKPTVRETWSANFLSGSGRVTALSVTPAAKREHPYLAVALSDRSTSVWTYKSALSGAASKANEPSKRWLFPLCRLDAVPSLAEGPPAGFGSENSGFDIKDAGYCTELQWLPQQTSVSSLLLLAASFQNGIAIFHVGLPMFADTTKGEFRPLPEPTQSTIMSQTPNISPLAVRRWLGRHERSYACWLNLGPHANPCLGLLLHASEADGGSATVILGALRLPLYRRGPSPKERQLPFDVLAFKTLSKDAPFYPQGLLQINGMRHLVCFDYEKVIRLVPTRSNVPNDPCFLAQLCNPISSDPPGLSSFGESFLTDSVNDKDGILHIFTVIQCERHKSDSSPNMQEWSRPRRRHWLCRTVVGDTKTTCIAEEAKDDRGFGGDEAVKGGASSDVICELFDETLEGLAPVRIVRCKGADVCAVLFRPAVSAKTGTIQGFALDASHILFVDYSGPGSVLNVVAGRDVAFWPIESNGSPRGVLLNTDASALSSFSWERTSKACEMGSASRPIVGVDTDKNFVECRRVFTFSGASMVGLVVVGTRHRDGRWCLLSGDICTSGDVSTENWSTLLPNMISGSVLWLDEGEEVFSVVGLEHDDTGYRNFAVATSLRVVIASSGMEVVASIKSNLPPCNLAPLGSFAVAFCSDSKLRYLTCLEGSFTAGAIASLPLPPVGESHAALTAIRPDRFLVLTTHNGTRLVEYGQNPHVFLLPTAVTKPALLLEPLVANAICVGGKQNVSTPALRTVIEKFGRKLVSITHGEDEGIGNIGAGLTPKVFEMLEKYGLRQAASWLLTGSVLFDRSANTKILPPWLPLAPKAKGALNSDAFLHIVANGDPYLSEYLKSPDGQLPAALPHPSGSIAYVCSEYSSHSIREGRPFDALKTLDLVGADSSDNLILELTLALSKDHTKDATPILKALCGYDESGYSRSISNLKAPAALAALAVAMKEGSQNGVYGMSKDQVDRWMKPLAPSLQRGSSIVRPRQKILGKGDLAVAGERIVDFSDPLWVSACNESKHVWNEGPKKEKNNLLLLGTIEEWLGRKRPVVVGKEGASAARDRGEKTLADILNKEEEDSFGGKSDLENEKDGWVDGVGEGRSDEANLSAYYRMSEGEDEDSSWRSQGIEDISPFQNRAKIVGDAENVSLQPTSSSVDEGETGKVKSLYDLVFEKSGDGVPSGVSISASRGGSLDVGLLHQSHKSTRHKCSIEFWYYLPTQENVPSETVLARRTMGSFADELSKVSLAVDKESVLWELVLRSKGELEFRTCAGSTLRSTQNHTPTTRQASKDEDSDDEAERADLAIFGRWNHVCIVLTQQRDSCSQSRVALYMKGTEVASSIISVRPPGFDEDDLDSETELESLLKKSQLLFGLNHGAGFRLTELRVWACERSAEDTQALLYEYLNAAEAKKKFKVKISNKKGGVNFGKGLAVTKSGTGLAPLGGKTTGRSILAPSKSGGLAPSKGFSLAPQVKVPPAKEPTDSAHRDDMKPSPSIAAGDGTLADSTIAVAAAGFEEAFGGFGDRGFGAAEAGGTSATDQNVATTSPEEEEVEDDEVPTSLWDTAIPLSQQVRSSAAAALIRGPPATRHFGGNRGGLPDFSGMDRFGVGGIAICGSEKTIVWRDNEDPPALTYPIGASGAVVSDLMDDEGSEFLCCFLAKEKRMVVFELQSRTVVVELQMTTKLNFWRFLPPEAAENTLCFMLVTPVGGFHWMPLEESPRPHQVWKRGAELQGKKVVSYEEGGSNGLDGPDILSRVGLVMVTKASGGGALEAWIVPVDGDSQAGQVSDDVMGACFCQPPFVEDGPFLPLLMTVHQLDEGIYVNVLSVTEPKKGSVQLGEIEVTRILEDAGFEDVDFEPPDLAMGSFPEAICCSLGNIVVIIIRRKGLIAAFELEEDDLSLIALEGVDHYVIDAVMRYSAEVGGAEIVMLLSDSENPKDGRMVSFCFRSAV